MQIAALRIINEQLRGLNKALALILATYNQTLATLDETLVSLEAAHPAVSSLALATLVIVAAVIIRSFYRVGR